MSCGGLMRHTIYTLGLTLVWTLSACGGTELVPDASVTDTVTADQSVAEVTTEPDITIDDTTEPDIAPPPDAPSSACEPGEGCFGEACDGADDCLSGVCTMHLGDKVCSKTCDSTCPVGWSCTLVGAGGDGQYACMSDFSHLCLPCSDAGTCSGESPNACVQYTDGMSFCGGACDINTPCPSGYACQEVKSVEGASSFQCVNTAGVCPCSDLAIESVLASPCEVSNDLGTCSGVRVCEADGLTACSGHC